MIEQNSELLAKHYEVMRKICINVEVIVISNDLEYKKYCTYECVNCDSNILCNGEYSKKLCCFCKEVMTKNINNNHLEDLLLSADLIVYNKNNLYFDKNENKTLLNMMKFRDKKCYLALIYSESNSDLDSSKIDKNDIILMEKNIALIYNSFLFEDVRINELLINAFTFKDSDIVCNFERFWKSFHAKYLELK